MGLNMVPKRIFLTNGVGKHKERLTSFELALRDAGIAAQNLVRVSSIFPPHCKLISRKEGVKYLHPGEVTFAVVAENSTREPHRLTAASIGLAMPADRSTYGYLSEHHSFGEADDVAGEYAEELAAEMLATTLNVDFNPDTSWDEKKEIYRISNKIVRTTNITQSGVGDKRGPVDHGDCVGHFDLRVIFSSRELIARDPLPIASSGGQSLNNHSESKAAERLHPSARSACLDWFRSFESAVFS